MRSNPTTLAEAMMILSRDIHCEDGVATAAIAEAGCRLLEQRDEIARLRLTDAERIAVEAAANARLTIGVDNAAALRGLLERHFPTPENPPSQDNTPEPHSNQSECSVQELGNERITAAIYTQ